MTWIGFFEGIQSFFENVAFIPYNVLRNVELESWWLANVVSWILMAIGFAAFIYWMAKLKKINDNNEEDRTSTAHTYLG